ncbi:glycosyltransferase family 2 protein [Glaciibacter superstes]|uniref:glycosyltransferase family 2 protein n=1 Tax=Glaciibacter superstes TaxID=501023 RepID=UPI0003B7B174|nr:glycosyltransferase family 2 protein [Glaciibacter superstes]
MPTSERVRCTVIVVNWNGGDDTAACLRSLIGQSAEGVAIDLLVVDNGSTDGSAESLERDFPSVTMLRTGHNLGFGGAVNHALSATSGDYAVLVNNDALAEDGFVAALLAPFSTDDRIGAVTARIVLTGRFEPVSADVAGSYRRSDGSHWTRSEVGGVELLNSTGNIVSRSGNGQDRSWLVPVDDDNSAEEVFGFSGGGCALRRSTLVDVGAFDDSLFMYYEDTDLAWRMRRRRWSIRYARDATLHHRHAGSSGVNSPLFLVNNVRNRILTAAKNGPSSMLLASLWRTLGSLAKSFVQTLRGRPSANSRFRATVSGLLGALRRLPHALSIGRELDTNAREPRSFIRDWTIED